jgi:hypothetical protein
MYGKEYNAWIACKAICPCIVETVNMFKTFWAAKITLMNQTAIPASMHGYGMAAMNNDNSVALYGELIANFGAAYAATQESVKSQGATIASMQGQMQAMQHYFMALGQQSPPGIYTLQQQQCAAAVCCVNLQMAAEKNPASMVYQQPRGFPGGQQLLQPPTPFKMFENWNYSHMHGRDVNNTHTGMRFHHPGPSHNPNGTRTNMMGDNMAGLHRTILPSASGCFPPAQRQPQAPAPTIWQQPPP